MSGEGHIASVPTAFELRQRLEQRIAELTEPSWDKRPGALEALPPAPRVCGARAPTGWAVQLMLPGAIVRLSPDEARALAAELTEYAELAEGRRW